MLVQVKRNKVGLEYLENVLKEWGRWGMLSHRITYKRNRQDHKEKMRGHTIYGKVSGENRWEHYMDSVLHLARASSSQFWPVWKKSEKVVGEFWKFFFFPPSPKFIHLFFFFFSILWYICMAIQGNHLVVSKCSIPHVFKLDMAVQSITSQNNSPYSSWNTGLACFLIVLGVFLPTLLPPPVPTSCQTPQN